LRLVGRSPAWLISIALHALVLLIATAFAIEERAMEDDSPYHHIRHTRSAESRSSKPPKPKEPRRKTRNDAESQSLPPGEAEPDANARKLGRQRRRPRRARRRGRPRQCTTPWGSARAAGRGRRGSGPVQPVSACRAGAVTERARRFRWLVCHQAADGSWSVTQFRNSAGNTATGTTARRRSGNDQFDVGVTGLARWRCSARAILLRTRSPCTRRRRTRAS
jgi:hypothetical protein